MPRHSRAASGISALQRVRDLQEQIHQAQIEMRHAADDVYVDFGLRLKKAREEAGMTQLQVADLVGLTRTSISNIETGKQRILLHDLYVLSSAIGCSPLDLLNERLLK